MAPTRREDADDLSAPLDLAIDSFQRVGAVDLLPVVFGKAHEGEHIGFGLVHQDGKLCHLGSDLIGHLTPLGAGHFSILLGKGGGDEGGNDTPALLAGVRQDVAHEVHAATLPGGVEYLGNRRLEALMRIRDYQLDAPETAPCERAQEFGPEGLGLESADRDAQHLAPTIAVDGDGDNDRDRDNATSRTSAPARLPR
jgi:hypothetical protein